MALPKHHKRSDLLTRFLCRIIWLYRMAISPYLPAACRYWPTCSVYAHEAIRRFGPVKGSWLAVKRICRCHPFVRGGYDPVPPRNDSSSG